MRDVRLSYWASILDPLYSMLLYQDPAIATVLEGLYELIAHIRIVGQGHFTWGKTPDSA
jgi:hypothetical protein